MQHEQCSPGLPRLFCSDGTQRRPGSRWGKPTCAVAAEHPQLLRDEAERGQIIGPPDSHACAHGGQPLFLHSGAGREPVGGSVGAGGGLCACACRAAGGHQSTMRPQQRAWLACRKGSTPAGLPSISLSAVKKTAHMTGLSTSLRRQQVGGHTSCGRAARAAAQQRAPASKSRQLAALPSRAARL